MKPVNYSQLKPKERRVVREDYVNFQEGLCYYCKAPLSGAPALDVSNKRVDRRLFPDGFFRWPVHLHHDHVTGMTIGAVHNHCNAVLWEYDGE
jgi:hypothetical protein